MFSVFTLLCQVIINNALLLAKYLVTDWRQLVLLTLYTYFFIDLFNDRFPCLIAEQNYATDCCVSLP